MTFALKRERGISRSERRVVPAVEKPTLLLDCSIYIFQYYFSLPDRWSSKQGCPTGAVYGFTTFLLRLLQDQQPQRIAACFDESLGSCFRNQVYPHYKSSRAAPDEALSFQLRACREVAELLGLSCFSSSEYEADDLIGSLSFRARRSRTPLAILTRDKDLGQLLRREQDWIWDYANNERFYAHHIRERFGVSPLQVVDYLALVGDSIDDIPGVPGLGPKTAQALLTRFGSIDGIFAELGYVKTLNIRGAEKLGERLSSFREQIYLARRLATIVEHLPLTLSVRELNWHPRQAQLQQLTRFFEMMGFPRFASRAEQVFGV